MGVENNEAVLATTWSGDVIKAIGDWVGTLPKHQGGLFHFAEGIVNIKTTILLAPCGSKKGWETDTEIAFLRQKFIDLIESFNYDDGSSPIDWVEVGYGEFGQKVLRGNCINCYSDADYAE